MEYIISILMDIEIDQTISLWDSSSSCSL